MPRVGYAEFGEIVARVTELAAAAEEQVVAEVRSAIQLDDQTLDRLTAKLAEATGRSVTVRAVVDPSVIGGVVAKVGRHGIRRVGAQPAPGLARGMGITKWPR